MSHDEHDHHHDHDSGHGHAGHERPKGPLPKYASLLIPPDSQYPVLRVRKNLYNLTADEIDALRRAYAALYALSEQNPGDERGYQWIAGVHGLPLPFYCQHGNLNFVTWHRAYLYELELRLQEQVPGVMLPYWDWASQQAIDEGIPAVLADPTYVDPDSGETKPNPLYSAFSQVTGTQTQRSPSPSSELAQLRVQVQQALAQTVFPDFSFALENPHGGLHVWMGGDMGSVPTAAYDPIFWLHHCNVDRQWFEWQEVNGNTTVPDAVRKFVCNPFPYTGEQTLDPTYFGYTYADSESRVALVEAQQPQQGAEEAVLPPTLRFDLGRIDHQFSIARLEFHRLAKTHGSYRVHVYCDSGNGQYDAGTGTSAESNYANTLYLFGEGGCAGAPGHCDIPEVRPWYDRRPPHHLEPYNTYLDVTAAVQRAVAGKRKEVQLSFVVLDPDGRQVDPGVIEFEAVALMTYR
jgi:tyrosinase